MPTTLFKLGCLMIACFTAFAYLVVAIEPNTIERDTFTSSVSVSDKGTTSEAPMLSEEQQEKGCRCCVERMAQLQKRMEKVRKHNKQAQILSR